MKTFKWCIRPNFEVNNEPKVDEMEFGDGYKQRRTSGINALLQAYSVTVKVKNKERFDVHEFLREHKGIKPFLFNDPYSGQQVKVVCKKWPAKVGTVYTEFSCDFEETL